MAVKAARIHEYGSPEVFRIEDVPEPTPGPDDVLVRVHASSVNPVDWKIRSGVQRAVVRLDLPWILGLDFSGVVEAIGDRVTRFRPGDEVYGSPTHKRPGTYAEKLCVRERECALKPEAISHAEAASLPLVALTAWEALVRFGKLERGQHVLIQAGSGGVGSVAIQIAKALGAEVSTTCSTRNIDLVRELGADRVIDYGAEQYDDVLTNLDLVLDALGGDHRYRAVGVTRRGGRVASIVAGIPEHVKKRGPVLGTFTAVCDMATWMLRARLGHGVKAANVMRKSDAGALADITRLVATGKLRPILEHTYSLEEIAEAHRRSETGRVRGKLAIAIA